MDHTAGVRILGYTMFSHIFSIDKSSESYKYGFYIYQKYIEATLGTLVKIYAYQPPVCIYHPDDMSITNDTPFLEMLTNTSPTADDDM